MKSISPHFFHVPLIALVLVLGAHAQSVKFNVVRAEVSSPATQNATVRVLLDTSLKSQLDKHKDELVDGKRCECQPEPAKLPVTPDACTPYWAMYKLFKEAFVEIDRTRVVYQPDGTKKEIKEKSSANFYLFNLKSGEPIHFKNAFKLDDILKKEPLDTAEPVTFTLAFDTLTPLDPSAGEYVLMANVGTMAEGKKDTNTHITKLAVLDYVKTPTEVAAKPTDEEVAQAKIAAEKDRDVAHFLRDSKAKNPNVVTSFGMKGSRTNYIYTHDIAIRVGRLHRLGLGGAYDINWFFLDHKYSSDKGSPLDDLKFGIKANHILHDPFLRKKEADRDLINSFTTTVSGHIETDFLFSDQVNFVGGIQSGAPINIFNERSMMTRITPFIGYELGYRIKDETPSGKEKLISRGLFGVNLFIVPFRREKSNPLQIEIDYIRRVLLKAEPEYFVDFDGVEFFGSYNRGPKDFVKGRVTYNFNSTFAPFFQYSYGKTPGKYLLQNGSIEAGVKVSLDWKKD